MSNKPTSLATSITPDTPLVQNASAMMDAQDRQYIDTQILALQQHITQSLLRGIIGTWVTLANSSVAVVPGDVVCLTGGAGQVTKAVLAAISPAVSAYGVVLQGGAPNTLIRVATMGYLPAATTGLGTTAGFIRVNTTTARLERVATVSASDYPMGVVMATGDAMLLVQPLSAGGGGGLPTDPTFASVSPGTGPFASSGDIRGSATFAVRVRNAADTADVDLVSMNADDATIGDAARLDQLEVSVKTGGYIGFKVNSVEIGRVNSSGIQFAAYRTSATNPAASGLLRGANNTVLVAARNAANSGDIVLLATDASDTGKIGDAAGPSHWIGTNLSMRPSGSITFEPTGGMYFDPGGQRVFETIFTGGTKRLGFYGATAVVKPTVTGSKGANAALASLLTALANQGLITDSSS